MYKKPSPKDLIFDSLPFFSGVLDSPRNNSLPACLPFTLKFDDEKQLISQRYSAATEKVLDQAYKQGSLLSTNLGQGSFGVRRANDALKHLSLAINGKIQGKSFLEIGCADGYLLRRLKDAGAGRVLGCEPGPAALEGSRKHDVKIVNAYYEEGVIEQTFDCVLSYGVLEHILDPGKFIRTKRQALNEEGVVFVAVPNCELKLNLGDISVLGHEHWSYFTRNSLRRLLVECMLTDVNACIGENNAMIYAWGSKSSGKADAPLGKDEDKNLFRNFQEKIGNVGQVLHQRAKELKRQGKTIGLYGGGLNMSTFLPAGMVPRFFDGDVEKHGKYFPGYETPIEPAENLTEKKVDEIWVAAIDYTAEITEYLQNQLNIASDIEIVSIKTILEHA